MGHSLWQRRHYCGRQAASPDDNSLRSSHSSPPPLECICSSSLFSGWGVQDLHGQNQWQCCLCKVTQSTSQKSAFQTESDQVCFLFTFTFHFLYVVISNNTIPTITNCILRTPSAYHHIYICQVRLAQTGCSLDAMYGWHQSQFKAIVNLLQIVASCLLQCLQFYWNAVYNCTWWPVMLQLCLLILQTGGR